jgi:hypothetical protein
MTAMMMMMIIADDNEYESFACLFIQDFLFLLFSFSHDEENKEQFS